MKRELICCLETSVTNYEPTPRNMPQETRPQLNSGGSLKYREKKMYWLKDNKYKPDDEARF